jgi:hypothetical protein
MIQMGMQSSCIGGRANRPTLSVYRQFVVEGGLMAYGPDTPDIFRRSAAYVDRILKGDKPGDRPVQEPIRVHHQPEDREGVYRRRRRCAPTR